MWPNERWSRERGLGDIEILCERGFACSIYMFQVYLLTYFLSVGSLSGITILEVHFYALRSLWTAEVWTICSKTKNTIQKNSEFFEWVFCYTKNTKLQWLIYFSWLKWNWFNSESKESGRQRYRLCFPKWGFKMREKSSKLRTLMGFSNYSTGLYRAIFQTYEYIIFNFQDPPCAIICRFTIYARSHHHKKWNETHHFVNLRNCFRGG